ncbi:MAG: galactose-1-epimerase, partial [Muribaculaceae bacterium]|nr:galactose-1-epimerase [Muribaculaceae bacterium]
MKIETVTQQTVLGEVRLFILTNDNGAQVVLSSLGAGIVSVRVPDNENRLDDVVIGYDRAEDYIADGPCAGKTPGRYANRIAKGRFSLDGRTYELPVNNGPNHLHGGPDGYQNRIWNARAEGDDKVVFSLHSPDGDAGYP